ncbi:MAG TPA: o-succinylbenzoate synthase [Candidatus Didemnitutus sp.]|nr:o-succinylbenzoate synthase [Candidatus Didemnitutus sp.]
MRYLFSCRKYNLPLKVPLKTAHGVWSEREGILIRLEDEAGKAGFGEIAPIEWFGTETLTEAEAVCGDLGDKPDGAKLDAVPGRFACVRFALTAARSGTVAKKSDRRLPVAALLPAGRAALEVLPAKLEAGFLAFKWKVGVRPPAEELGILDDLLGMLPAYTRLRLDANGAWGRRQAEAWLARCAERPVEFVEQPAAAEQVDLLLGLANDYPVTLALDESVTGLAAACEWQARGWPGVFVIKPALAGPLPEIADWMTRTKPDVVFSSAIETALARAAILRFVLAHDLTKRALGFGVGQVFGDRRWDGPLVGPLLDAGWCDAVAGEELWNALS